jgi:2,3-bisphosphoglycerate-dependent phosphoglycerate mutase
MKKLVLLRHGESEWNKDNRFTGWTDVDLSEKGVEEAREAGRNLKIEGFFFNIAYTSYLKRAIKTLWLALEEMDQIWIPVVKSWRLNEKHYGNLQGMNKTEIAEKFGPEKVLMWRRSFDIPPEPLEIDDERHPRFDPKYNLLAEDEIPATESLKETIERIMPFWEDDIFISIEKYDNVFVVAHGNSLRAIVKHLKNMSNEDIVGLNLPTGIPYVFEFDEKLNLINDYFIGDEEEIKKLMQKVADQAKK